MSRASRSRGGTSFLEFTLVGIPMIFALISTFEVGRGMWNYHAMGYAVAEGTRYASVHGVNCMLPNSCTVTVAQITQKILDAGIGLPASSLTLKFISTGGTITCLATNCLLNNSAWPSAPSNAVGSNIEIDATYPFQSAIAMFWPGAGPAVSAATVNFPASSRERIQF